MSELAEVVRGVTYNKSQACDAPRDGFVPILRANNIKVGGLWYQDLVYVQRSCISNAQELCPGDIVIAMSSGSLSVVGKSAQIENPWHGSFGAFCGVLRVLPEINSRYFYYFTQSSFYRNRTSELAAGVNINNLKPGHFEEIQIPVAPCDEQRRIAMKLDSLLAQVETLKARIDRIPTLLKHFRQATIHDALAGKLTTSCGYVADASTWLHVRAEDVCGKVQSGGTPKEGFTESGIPFLKVYNIVNGTIDFDYRPQHIADDVHHGSCRKSITRPGDVLMNIVGPPLGKIAVVTSDHPEWNINQAITLFRPGRLITSGWIHLSLLEGTNIRNVSQQTKGSAGQVNISLSQCRNFIFSIPPIEIQNELVLRVEQIFAIADQLEDKVSIAKQRIDVLTQSILAKAFRGELVPQDPSDEPASALLERIRAQRATVRKPKRGRKATSN